MPRFRGLFTRFLLWFTGTVFLATAVTAALIAYLLQEDQTRYLEGNLATLRKEAQTVLEPSSSSTPGKTPPSPGQVKRSFRIWIFDESGKLVAKPQFPPPPPECWASNPFRPAPPPGFGNRDSELHHERRGLPPDALLPHHGPPPDDDFGRNPEPRHGDFHGHHPLPLPPDWVGEGKPPPHYGSEDGSFAETNLLASAVPVFLSFSRDFQVIEIGDQDFLASKITQPSGQKLVGFRRFRPLPYFSLPRSFAGPMGRLHIPVLIVLGSFVCWVLARSLSRPVLEMQKMSRSISRGDFGERLPELLTGRLDELGDLARDFNVMADTIERALRNQKQLLRDISHELRSPLARSNIALELLGKGASEGQTNLVEKIRRDLERLNELIQQILDLSRFEQRGASDLPKASIDLGAFSRSIISDVKFEAELLEKRVGFDEPETPCFVDGNAEFLRRALENVLRNAIRHTAVDSEVFMRIARERCKDRNELVITVRDHGPGIPPAHLPSIFDPFFRCEEDRGRSSGGVGLGLAIVKRSIEAHGGSVTGRNHPEGGFEIEIRLPEMNVNPGQA